MPGRSRFPGGRIEPEDADPIAAALREAEEEIGLPRDHVELDRPARHLHHRHRLRDHAGRRARAGALPVRPDPVRGRRGLRGAARLRRRSRQPPARQPRVAGHARAASSCCPTRTAISGARPPACWSTSPRCWAREAAMSRYPHHRSAAAAADGALSAVARGVTPRGAGGAGAAGATCRGSGSRRRRGARRAVLFVIGVRVGSQGAYVPPHYDRRPRRARPCRSCRAEHVTRRTRRAHRAAGLDERAGDARRARGALTAGGAARFVGGCVRDALLGRAVGDIDIATPRRRSR